MSQMTPSQERDKLKAEKKKNRAEAKVMANQVGGDVAAVGAHTGTAILFTKYKRLQSFDKDGKVRVRAVLAIPLYIGGYAMGDDWMATGTRELGLIWGAVELERWVGTQTWAQPAAPGG